MRREVRRGVRVAVGILNIIIQLFMLWIIVRTLDTRGAQNVDSILLVIKSILTHMSIMIGSYFIYSTLVNLITKRNISGTKNDQ